MDSKDLIDKLLENVFIPKTGLPTKLPDTSGSYLGYSRHTPCWDAPRMSAVPHLGIDVFFDFLTVFLCLKVI